jgi:alpha-glucosidase
LGGPADPHHDGSELYVSNPEPSLGEVVTVFVRCPDQAGVSQVAVRSTPNAEPRFVQARQDRRGDHETWRWRTS